MRKPKKLTKTKPPLDYLDRAVLIHCCKDRTLSYRTRKEPIFNGRALPVFSVDTKEEAENLLMLIGTRQYEEHPLIPNRPWLKVNVEYKRYLELNDLPTVTAICKRAYDILSRNK